MMHRNAERGRYRLVVSALAAFALTSACGDSSVSPPAELPTHTSETSSLAPRTGKRVALTVTNDISRDECRALINAYRREGAPDGQVVVHKPSAALGGQSLPWCVENYDGEGIRFNDELF